MQNKFSFQFFLCGFCSIVTIFAIAGDSISAQLSQNLATKATITANSEYSSDYLAKYVADNQVPIPKSNQDLKKAWCVNGATNRNGAEILFDWKKDVTIAEIIYYARTAWFMNECWKDFEIFFDSSSTPQLSGRLKMIHGPQRITISPPVKAKQLKIKFTSSYNGFNPGASEIQIFSKRIPQKALENFMKSVNPGIPEIPGTGKVNIKSLKKLICNLQKIHGQQYKRADSDLIELKRLEHKLLNLKKTEHGETPAIQDNIFAVKEQLNDLQRKVLLFDIDKLVVIKRHEIIASHVYTYHYEGFRPGGGLYIVQPRDRGARPVELVSSSTGQILDCDLSYDGKTILFSWRRKKEEGYHLWTIDVNGSNLRCLTEGRWNDYNGCWLPDGGIAFLSTRAPQFAYCWNAPVGIVYRMNSDGSKVRKLSSNYLNDFTPYPLQDGRIIYSRWEYVDKPAIPIQSLWTIHPDGTCLSQYFGNGVLSPGTFMEAKQVPGTQKIICTMTGHNGPTRGAIGIIDRNLGLNSQASITNITPDVPVPPVNRGNGNTSGTKQYSCPFPLDSIRFLVSIRGPVLVRMINGKCQSIVLPAPQNGMQYFSAQPVRPRKRPPTLFSTLTMAKDNMKFGYLYLQNVYRGLGGKVAPGEIKRLRVVRELQKSVRIDPGLRAFGFQFPVISCGATYAGKQVLGEVEVKPDGSAFFKVPAEIPIYFMVLDSKGRAVQRMRSFTSLMPGEFQGCVGCHESRNSTPLPDQTSLYRQKCEDLVPPEWGVGGFNYSRIVQPVLDSYCIKCHNPHEASGGIDLTGGKTDYFNVSYDVLARENQGAKGSRYVNWIPTYNGQEQNILETTPKAWGSPKSRLADIVLSGHPGKNGIPRFKMDEKSRRRVLAWIDLNVPYYGSSETAYPGKRGCRRIYPKKLDTVLQDVAKRRCAQCHKNGKIPRKIWTRITEPQQNLFLLAPLARSAGGIEKCGRVIFKNREDPDYVAILKTFNPVLETLKKKPRMDMPGGKPEPGVCRDCQ